MTASGSRSNSPSSETKTRKPYPLAVCCSITSPTGARQMWGSRLSALDARKHDRTPAPAATEKAWLNRMKGFLRKIERGANQLAAGNYASGLSNFLVCTARLTTTVGPPPTSRLNRVYSPMKQACRKLEAGARHVVGGRETQAVTAFRAAVRHIDRVTKALSALT